MRECFKLARRGTGFVSPNPMVGCVLVRGGKILASGYHRRFGNAHAEVECLRTYRGNTHGTTLYVNLEPCVHQGKTPPCVDLILQRGIPNVVIATRDVNPLVAGKGISRLRTAGVDVKVGVLEREARELNRFFFKHMRTRMPYVHVKIAQTLDGKIAPARKRSAPRYLTSPDSLKLVHISRAEYDAVLVGAGTIIEDDPQLNVRLVKGRDPAVIILDGRLRVSGKEKTFAAKIQRQVILCTTAKAASAHRRKVESLRQKGVRVLEFASRNSRIDLTTMLSSLYDLRIGSVLVEGGRDVFTQFAEARMIDEMSIFVAPKVCGSGTPAFSDGVSFELGEAFGFKTTAVQKIGDDTLIHFSKA
ncbi:MAG: bifunctional diaminohydroxyphosphoribosylaminopyrimidine deaminase/5-amino-6-(5-phosphoribosylamino)uracil reductase RibD [Ignavibacteriae bacterium]|nr:bifunctional diaminohydroxyphosphoribosylaminopyrimidine deaminase/5-amino-6-(5-phosphoribosylamino)uracil reductase RibD [Ignavibacteriota bacterium]